MIPTEDIPTPQLTNHSQIPAGFGSLYVGQTFTSYICVTNHSDFVTSNVSIRTLIHSPSDSKRASVSSTGADESEIEERTLQSKESWHLTVSEDILLSGEYTLEVRVQYETEEGAPKQYKKLYRMTSTPCLSIRTKISKVRRRNESDGNFIRAVLEVQLENTTREGLFIRTLELSPLDNWSIRSLNDGLGIISSDEDFEISNVSLGLLNPGDINQYMYELTRMSPPKDSPTPVGRLKIHWQATSMEVGKLATSISTPTAL